MAWYEIISIVISAFCALGFGTVMQMFWKDRHDKKKENTDAAKKRAKEERQQEAREVVKEVVDPLIEKIDLMDERSKLTAEGTKAGLRTMLLDSYKECAKKGYRTETDIMNWQDLIDAYHNLGGNSFIDEIKDLMDDIDTEEKYLAKKKAARKAARKKNK